MGLDAGEARAWRERMRDRRRRHPAQLPPQMPRARESRPAACRCRDRLRPGEWSCRSCRHCRGGKDTGNAERARRYKSLQISRALKHAGKANERGCPSSGWERGQEGRKETPMTKPVRNHHAARPAAVRNDYGRRVGSTRHRRCRASAQMRLRPGAGPAPPPRSPQRSRPGAPLMSGDAHRRGIARGRNSSIV